MGEACKDAVRCGFDRTIKLQSHGATASSDIGLFPYRHLDGAAGVPAALKQWFDEAAWFDVMRAHPEDCRAAAHWAIVASFTGAPWLDTGAAAPVAPIDGRLALLEVPVLLYNGEHDLADFVDVADRLEALLPRVRRATIAGAGGFPAWEFPARVNRLAEDFLSSLAPGSPQAGRHVRELCEPRAGGDGPYAVDYLGAAPMSPAIRAAR